MAKVTTTEGVTRGAATWHGLPEEILLPPISLSGRHSYDEADIASLAHEIAQRGQDTPVMIRKDKQGKWLLVYGRRRYYAVQYANKHKLGKHGPIQLVATYEANMTDEEALIAAIAENFQRKEVCDADHAHNIGQLLKFAKKTVDQIAAIYFPGAKTPEAIADAVRWIKVRAGIDQELSDEGKQAMREGILTTTAAAEMTKLPPETQQAVIAEVKATGKKVKGKTRIKVADVKKAKPVKADSSKKPTVTELPSPAQVKRILIACEEMACAVDKFLDDPNENDGKIIKALEAYRKLVPVSFRQLEGKAA